MKFKVGFKSITILVLLLILLSAAGLLLVVYLQRGNPVLIRHVDRGDLVGTPDILILNPFRDRRAENTAVAFLEQLKAGQCSRAVEPLYVADPNYRQYICEREAKLPIRSWSLADRVETGPMVRIYFFNSRGEDLEQDGQLWVTVERRGDDWRVVNYECWY